DPREGTKTAAVGSWLPAKDRPAHEGLDSVAIVFSKQRISMGKPAGVSLHPLLALALSGGSRSLRSLTLAAFCVMLGWSAPLPAQCTTCPAISFAMPLESPLDPNSESPTAAVGDFDGDGYLDVAVADPAHGTIVVFRAPGLGIRSTVTSTFS